MKKKFLIALGLVVILVMSVLYSYTDVTESYYDTESTQTTNIGNLTKDKEVRLEFIADKNNLGSISLMIGTYSRANLPTMDVQILDEEQRIVAQKSINLMDVTDNSYYKLSFVPYKESENRTFSVILSSPEAIGENAATIYTYQSKGDSTHLYLNGVEQNYSLACRASYYNNFDVATLVVLMYFIALIIFFIIFIYKIL